MSGPASSTAEQKKNALAMDSSVRQQLPLVRPSGAHADVLALHKAVGNRAFTAATRSALRGSVTVRRSTDVLPAVPEQLLPDAGPADTAGR